MFGNDGYGGGFDVSGFGGDETPQAEKKGFKRTDRLISVTVRQVLTNTDSELKVGHIDLESQMVKLIGIVKKITRSSIKVMYTLEDDTGAIEGVHWLDTDAEDSFVVPVVENTYCVMIGAVRNTTANFNQRHIMVFHIFPITDLNEVTAHTLQIIYIALKSEDMSQQQSVPDNKLDLVSSYGGGDTSMVGGTDYAKGFNLNTQQYRVLKAVAQNSQSEQGASVEDILTSLTVKMPAREIQKILDYLAAEGHVYSTSDDKHYKATDGFSN